ncbi:hypothetical protein FACS189429_2550 [Bacteroidia bacterium]|nr:hypothetical protein FACS189429_2550 [Bacteroidia bacterium]
MTFLRQFIYLKNSIPSHDTINRVANNICLGQRKTEVKSNEITAIPELLKLLEIKSSIITIDAMGTQTAIAAKIIEKEAD